ncbi:MAG: diguanylate cyclase [Firmicutes bacterium]|nr:diguanylate cyclase [Bacillota bacterium]
MLMGNLLYDSQTGLGNFFGLLKAATNTVFGTKGTIITLDLTELIKDETNDKKTIDSCIRALAGLLRAEIARDDYRRMAAFRIGEGEFVIVLPEKTQAEAESLATEISILFREKAFWHSVPNAEIRTSIVTYGEYGKNGVSVSTILKAAYLALADCRYTEFPMHLPIWAEKLIDHMVERVYETLGLLDAAFTLALNDEVSGLPNYRAAELFFEQMLEEYRRYGEPCSVLLIDGDNLKQYNLLGYQQGNQMIRQLATLLKKTLRHNDRVARWLSGDEFLVFLHNADRCFAMEVGERLRAAVEEGSKDWPYPVTISVGVASCPEDGVTREELLVKAEEANNAAKRGGKNQVCEAQDCYSTVHARVRECIEESGRG